MLTICNRSRTPWAAAHYGIVAKVNRFSESTRKNRHNFPKYMGYRTKQGRLCNISPCSGDKSWQYPCNGNSLFSKSFLTKLYTHCNSFVTSPFYLCLKKKRNTHLYYLFWRRKEITRTLFLTFIRQSSFSGKKRVAVYFYLNNPAIPINTLKTETIRIYLLFWGNKTKKQFLK